MPARNSNSLSTEKLAKQRDEPIRISVLYLIGCPNREPACALVEKLLAELDLTADLQMEAVNNVEAAHRCRFLGSPTIQVNGVDIEPTRRTDTNYAMACRIYQVSESSSGLPSVQMIRSALSGLTGSVTAKSDL